MNTWEEVVSAVLAGSGLSAPAEIDHLVWFTRLKRRAHEGGDDAWTDGDELHYDATVPIERQNALLAHEVARWALRWCDVPVTDEALAYVARALTLAEAEVQP